jgi:hypothetical protein
MNEDEPDTRCAGGLTTGPRGEDSIPVLLMPGEIDPSPERLEQLGLTVDARRARETRPPA